MHFVLIFGPPAVGKMTVGHEVAQRTGFKLFHNHLSIEPLLGIFEVADQVVATLGLPTPY
jgi:shikimate kinase